MNQGPLSILLLAVGFCLILPSVAGADEKDGQSQARDANSTVTQSAGPAPDAATEERFRMLESKIDLLEKQNADLLAERDAKVDARLDDLARQVSYNYPDAYEKAALNMIVIGTYVTIAVTLAGVVYAFFTLAQTRAANRKDARRQAVEVVNGMNNFLTGRFSNTIALVLSEIAWDPENNYIPVAPQLTKVAVRYQKDGYEAFRKESCPEFEAKITEWTLKSLNNLVFMLSTTPDNPESVHINDYLTELRGRPEFWNHSVTVNTYAFALMVFRDDLAQKRDVPVTQILAEARDLLVLQQGKDLAQSSLRELNRLITLYDSLLGNPTEDTQTAAEAPTSEEGPPETEAPPGEEKPPDTDAPEGAEDAPAEEGPVR